MANLHNIDTMRRAGRKLDILTAYVVTGSSELVSLDWCQYKTLNTAHSHTKCKKLHCKGFACATRAKQIEICVFIFLCVKQVNNAK